MINIDDSEAELRHSSFTGPFFEGPSFAESFRASSAETASEDAIMSAATRNRRRRLLDLDRTACRTQQSHRRFLIQMASEMSPEQTRDPIRSGRFGRDSLSGRVDDWD